MSSSPTAAIDWYFDFVSPFAYLQGEILARDPLPGVL